MMVYGDDWVTRSAQRAGRGALVVIEQGDLDKSLLPPGLSIQVLPAADWHEAEQHGRDVPCCVLVDFDFDPTELARQLEDRRGRWMPLSCVACSSDTSVQNIVHAMRVGCVDFVPKPIQTDTLLAACAYACRIDASGEHSPRQFRSRVATLTEREIEVLKLFLDGRNTKTIAKQLGVTYQTIDKHRNRALKKMHSHSLIDLARVLKVKPPG